MEVKLIERIRIIAPIKYRSSNEIISKYSTKYIRKGYKLTHWKFNMKTVVLIFEKEVDKNVFYWYVRFRKEEEDENRVAEKSRKEEENEQVKS